MYLNVRFVVRGITVLSFCLGFNAMAFKVEEIYWRGNVRFHKRIFNFNIVAKNNIEPYLKVI